MSEEHSVLVPRTFLVLINPVAGLQRGESEFIQYVKPMFDKAEIISLIEVTSKCATWLELALNLMLR